MHVRAQEVLSRECDKTVILQAYRTLLQKDCWGDSVTVKKMFPLSRFQKFLHTKFPEKKNMWVSENRQVSMLCCCNL